MLNDIIGIAKEAGSVIKDGFGKNFGIEYKTNVANIVTEIDKKSEKLIIDFINKKYPGHSVLAEESGVNDKNSEYYWIIDPIDGTTNFAHGLPFFSVSIAVARKDKVIAGAVYDIMRDVMFSAEEGGGAYANGQKISVSTNNDLAKSLLVTGFPYDFNGNEDALVDMFKYFLLNSRAVRRLGSAALDMCYVANGVFDGFWESTLNPWDICGAKLIVEEAGGEVVDYTGKPLDIFGKQLRVLATNKKVSSCMLSVLSEHNKLLK